MTAHVEILEPRRLLSDVGQTAAPAETAEAPPPRQVERLGRGVVAVRSSNNQAFISWRLLGLDPASIAFNVYRSANGGAPVTLNPTPLTGGTNYVDATANFSQSNAYHVRPVLNGLEQAPSAASTIPPNSPPRQHLSVPLQVPAPKTTPDGVVHTYHANDASVGDLDGDGEYEIVLKWESTPSADTTYNAGLYLDAYKMNGTRLWRADTGRNIKTGAQFFQFIVYDLDGDGKTEVAMNTADGAVSGTGQVIGDPTRDWRNSSTGYVITGPEYLTILNGQTGAILANTNLQPARGNVTDWGDDYGHRAHTFNASVAYLDGRRPSLVFGRGIYHGRDGFPAKTQIVAWDWRGGQLTRRWTFTAASNGANPTYVGQGFHNSSVGDVDGDGKDEIIWGAMAIDDNGAPLHTTRLGHGDAQHLSDMDPSRPGLEVFTVHESPTEYNRNGVDAGGALRDARTGQLLVAIPGGTADVGRGVALDIDPRPGYEMWTSASGNIYNVDGTIVAARPANMFLNSGVWWDADLYRELLDRTTVSDWNYGTDGRVNFDLDPAAAGTQGFAPGVAANNGTKENASLSGDILGDWREEVIWRTVGSTALHIYTTTIPTTTRIHTLMHDTQYRQAIAWQNVYYNQPPHPSFFLGNGMAPPPTPNITYAPLDLTPPALSGPPVFNYNAGPSIVARFTENVGASVGPADIVVTRLAGNQTFATTSQYNTTTNSATFAFPSTLPDGNYRAVLGGAGVTDAAGNAMAGTYTLDFFVLAADANRDREVDFDDLAVLAQNYNRTGGMTFDRGDFNYDGDIDFDDLAILAQRYNTSLPPPAAQASAAAPVQASIFSTTLLSRPKRRWSFR